MNRADLAAHVADAAGISKAQADAAVSSALDGIKDSLSGGESVTLIGFGTFSVSKRAARTGRNPATGKPLKIKAKNVAKFTAGKALKDAL
ncbi:MAG: HU family DNA-binding protein [Candidatus Latescibacteria bacterium]|jgi:DNA-binding protein HU-beta|nr:HU family DNA-binding protein [Candidatus Latescibacterota bacterium]